MNAHTPDGWTVKLEDAALGGARVLDGNGKIIAAVYPVAARNGLAALFAQAPALLAVVQMVVKTLEGSDDHIDDADRYDLLSAARDALTGAQGGK